MNLRIMAGFNTKQFQQTKNYQAESSRQDLAFGLKIADFSSWDLNTMAENITADHYNKQSLTSGFRNVLYTSQSVMDEIADNVRKGVFSGLDELSREQRISILDKVYGLKKEEVLTAPVTKTQDYKNGMIDMKFGSFGIRAVLQNTSKNIEAFFKGNLYGQDMEKLASGILKEVITNFVRAHYKADELELAIKAVKEGGNLS